MSVQGVKAIEAAIRKKYRAHAKGLRIGLLTAGLFLQRESQKIVPVEFSVLKNSAGTRMEGLGLAVEVIVSYGTEYAIYVHENLEAQHKPGKQAKFLETPLREKHGRMQELVLAGMKGAL